MVTPHCPDKNQLIRGWVLVHGFRNSVCSWLVPLLLDLSQQRTSQWWGYMAEKVMKEKRGEVQVPIIFLAAMLL